MPDQTPQNTHPNHAEASRVLKTFVPTPALPPPHRASGLWRGVKARYFSTPLNAALTLSSVWLFYLLLRPLIDWALIDSVWQASSRRECFETSPDGACWAGVIDWFNALIYGRYPQASQWRVNLTFGSFVLCVAPLFVDRFRFKGPLLCGLLLFPLYAAWLLIGGESSWWFSLLVSGVIVGQVLLLGLLVQGLTPWRMNLDGCWLKPRRSLAVLGAVLVLCALGVNALVLPEVETTRWGGLFLTLVIAVVAIVMALPIGIALALGRRSSLPVLRYSCLATIELVRSVPLITVLFMAVTLLPFFLPNSLEINKLGQVLVAVSLFAGAYMAETIRGGLQGVPRGQIEAAQALGLGYWRCMGLVVLPQALRMMIPNIVTSFISMLKDTTLVSIIGLFDIVLMAKNMALDKAWLDLHTEPLVMIAAIFFVLCFAMSHYSQYLEKRLSTSR